MEVAVKLGLTYLDLPPLPASLEQKVKNIANSIPADDAGLSWIENFYNNKIQAVSHVYGRDHTILPSDIQEQINDLYGDFFGEQVTGFVGKLDNIRGYESACSPAHCDRYRYIAINYLLQSGGDNVLTCFYKQHRPDDDLTQADNIHYEKLDLDSKIIVPIQRWHSYNVQYYHSVENIKTTRLMFSLLLGSNPTPLEYITRYSKLFKRA